MIRKLVALGLVLILVGVSVKIILPRMKKSEPAPAPTAAPTTEVSTAMLTAVFTAMPTAVPAAMPTAVPTAMPTAVPTAMPTAAPTAMPTAVPTAMPTAVPAAVPTADLRPSLNLSTVDGAAQMMEWMIRHNALHMELDGLSLSEEQMAAAARRHPEIDRYEYTTGSKMSLTLTLDTGASILSALYVGDPVPNEVYNIYLKAKQIVDGVIRPGMSDLEKEIALHDYIIHHCEYEINKSLHTEDARGFFEHGRLQCSGYSDTLRLLGWMAGLEICSVDGDVVGETGGHEWNLIRLDGLWYAVDFTWDDPEGGGWEYHGYLNFPHRLLESSRTFDRAALPEGPFAMDFDRNFYYAYRGLAVRTAAEAEALLRSRLQSGGATMLCSLNGRLDVNSILKTILPSRESGWSWNTREWEGPTGVMVYEITIQ